MVFLALHLPYLPASLEDLDSINFALGVRAFDVSLHQPHPPGYPVYVLAGKIVHAAVPSEAAALALVGIAAGTLAVFALFGLFSRIDAGTPPVLRSLGATAVAATAPLFWLTAARPLSDMLGLSAALAIQAMTLAPDGQGLGLVAASGAAGLAIGIRSQVAWLTLPLLALALWRARTKRVVAMAGAFLVGVALWAVPLVWLTGGPSAYWRVLHAQGAEDFSGVTMLWTTPTARELVRTLYYAFVAPWGPLWLAVTVLAVAAIGVARLLWRDRAPLAVLAVAFGPYLVFDLLFQEAVTTRYALPLVVPVAFLAVCGLTALPRRVSAVAVAVLAVVGGGVGERTLRGYASDPAPAVRMLTDMNGAGGVDQDKGAVLAMHRREEFDLRRTMQWMTGAAPPFPERLRSTPKHEWLELVNYWNGGGMRPVWFVADPLRSDLALINHTDPVGIYRWPFEERGLIGGVRPSEMDWYVFDRPEWYLGEGWSLTPETSGVAREDGRGLSHGPIQGWLHRLPSPLTIMIGGRNLSGPQAHLRVSVDGRTIDEFDVAPGFFLRMLSLPAGRLEGDGPYTPLAIASDPPSAEVVIEQFDSQRTGRVVLGYDQGWYEQEYNPATGVSWRWTSERATLRLRAGKRTLALTCAGETETFSRASRVTVRAGDRVLGTVEAGATFSFTVPVPADLLETGEAALTIETDQTYVPAERSARSHDQRHLGLKVHACRVAAP